MPRKADDVDVAQQEGQAGVPALQRLVRLDVKQVTPRLTVVEGGRVVYLGSNRFKTVTWPGSILLKPVMDAAGKLRVLKEVTIVGNHNYDFVKFSEAGELIEAKLHEDSDADLNGRPYSPCEHPEHLRLFLRQKNSEGGADFEVLIPAPYHRFMEEYVRRKERFRTQVEHDFKDSGGVTARHSVLGVA